VDDDACVLVLALNVEVLADDWWLSPTARTCEIEKILPQERLIDMDVLARSDEMAIDYEHGVVHFRKRPRGEWRRLPGRV